MILFLVAGSLLMAQTSFAENYEEKAGKIVADAFIFRPAGLLLTLGGSVVFVVVLPIALIGGGTKEAADTLVKQPFDYTFKRPLGSDLYELD